MKFLFFKISLATAALSMMGCGPSTIGKVPQPLVPQTPPSTIEEHAAKFVSEHPGSSIEKHLELIARQRAVFSASQFSVTTNEWLFVNDLKTAGSIDCVGFDNQMVTPLAAPGSQRDIVSFDLVVAAKIWARNYKGDPEDRAHRIKLVGRKVVGAVIRKGIDSAEPEIDTIEREFNRSREFKDPFTIVMRQMRVQQSGDGASSVYYGTLESRSAVLGIEGLEFDANDPQKLTAFTVSGVLLGAIKESPSEAMMFNIRYVRTTK